MITIRPIQEADNKLIAAVIRSVLIEHDVPKVGTAYADVSLDSMFETYSAPRSRYFVVENDGKIIGGAGISQLENESETICELQKMYFLPEARGLGVGSEMMEKCLTFAQSVGFEKCYLETMPYMHAAQKLYLKFGFHYIDAPMGCTGHTSCPVWMLKEL
ncbi:MAG TPA: GNAT family N-acetyltransferase [Flavobacterium sp.]|uniref:GNAT family N-acetyltransferase n=1 Tax=unclassified Flavobacterium TaxID=196869 RepID=UPI000E949F29|nr:MULTISPECIES: GNAT family N-acetyltransferase [unclassified Flavobacterium]HBI00130.1 GNAT family N-acetyltransferase [Flavobacterium sp.]HRE77297.1 GNAT family N-acetyltransferase [Flavobacterium sp.]